MRWGWISPHHLQRRRGTRQAGSTGLQPGATEHGGGRADRHGRDPSIHINVYYGDEWLVEEELPWLLQFHHDSGFSYRLADLANHPKDRVNKVFYIGDHDKLPEDRGAPQPAIW